MNLIAVEFVLVILGIVFFLMGFNVLREYERAVIFRWGRLSRGLIGGNGPGVVIIIPFIDKMVRVSLRTVTMDVPPQDVITKDNVSVKVNAVIYFRVVDQERAIIQVEDYLYATSMMAQTTLRSVLGQSQLDDLLSKREQINADLQRIIDQQTEPWGVKVNAVEVKNVDLPQEMQRAIARQAEAERERRAKVIHAEGEFEASRRLADAADVISRNSAALQLRYLQTLVEISSGKNSTTIFPIPIDTIAPFLKAWEKKAEP
ncbi:MAG: slipin family protein [Nitrospiraceae bacterium]|nr:MAG: slipin family protein [Nitrospiraceae bacterium]